MLSLGEGLEAGFYYRQMLEEILRLDFKTINIEAYVDNECNWGSFFHQNGRG